MTDIRPAPDFLPGFPSQGALIGPAWRAAWDLLSVSSTTWTASAELVEQMRKAAPITEKTARNLLRQARQRNVLDVERVRTPGLHHPTTLYRIARASS